MNSIISYLFLVTLFACLFQHATSIKCYSCDTVNHKNCRKNYSHLKQNCPASTVCGIMQVGDLIVRSCGLHAWAQNHGDNGEYELPTLGKVSWSSCDTDLCNKGYV